MATSDTHRSWRPGGPVPQEGDVAICSSCRAINRYDKNLKLEKIPLAELFAFTSCPGVAERLRDMKSVAERFHLEVTLNKRKYVKED